MKQASTRRKSASPGPAGASHGYSGTPLAAKLGFKPGLRIACLGAPANYLDLLAPLPQGVELVRRVAKGLDGVHLFVDRRARLQSGGTLRAMKDKCHNDTRQRRILCV